jgi:7-cyano-7-deazaguanine synthase
MTGKKKAVCLFSGGADSTTLLYYMKNRGYDVQALTLFYGQRHKKEILATKKIVKELGIKHTVANVSQIQQLISKSSLTSSMKVPKGHYTKETMKQTVVPNRNMILIALATGYAITLDADTVAYAAHASDHAIYPDCRPPFVEKMKDALKTCDYKQIELEAPFLSRTKGQVIALGLSLNVPYEKTWSCYEGNKRPCLKCGTCVERTESFKENGVQDPALTEQEWKKALKYLDKYSKEMKK